MATPPTRSAIKFDLFADQARKRKLQALGDPLEVISHHIDFAHLAGLIDELLPCKDTSKGGRPPYPTEVMVRILVLKHLHNLNDEQLEFQLLDRMNHQRFCPLVDSQLLRHGYLARCGQIIDATLVSAPIQHFTKNERAQFDAGQIPQDWSAAKRRQKDLDATHTKKHGKRYHGYKLSISVDVRHKFIRKIETGTASEHDSTHFDDVLDQGNTGADVYADKGYPRKDRTQMLRALGFRERIQRKAKLGKPLSACQKGRNQRIAKIRARVGHPFAQMRHMDGKIIRTIGQIRATVA